MLVVDASAIVELLLATNNHPRIADAIADHSLHAPDLIGVEVVSALRRLALVGALDASRAREALELFDDLGLSLYEPTPFLDRMFDLRAGLTAYDAAYVALAEVLGAPLLTCDTKLARSRGHGAVVQLA